MTFVNLAGGGLFLMFLLNTSKVALESIPMGFRTQFFRDFVICQVQKGFWDNFETFSDCGK